MKRWRDSPQEQLRTRQERAASERTAYRKEKERLASGVPMVILTLDFTAFEFCTTGEKAQDLIVVILTRKASRKSNFTERGVQSETKEQSEKDFDSEDQREGD